MSIDKEKIIHISKLARISIDSKKSDSLAKDLTSIFKFIEQLNEINTDKIQPLSSILNTPLRTREDKVDDGKILLSCSIFVWVGLESRCINNMPFW